MKIYNKICKFVLLGIVLVNIILSCLNFGKRVFYNSYIEFLLDDIRGVYWAYLHENNVFGMITIILYLLIVIGMVIVLILNYVKKREVHILEITIYSSVILSSLFGIISTISAKNFIYETIRGAQLSYGYAISYFTANGILILDSVLCFSIFMIQLAVVAIVFTFILKNKQKF